MSLPKRKPSSRAKSRSPTVTLEMANEIRQMVKSGMAQHEVAAHFGINQGRVSEVVNGHKFPNNDNSPPTQPTLI